MLIPIPPEIIDAIVDELANDKSLLKICATVSPAFLSACRKHLFRVITLDSAERLIGYKSFSPRVDIAERLKVYKPYSRLFRLLSHHPEILHHIHELILRTGHWMLKEPDLPKLLQLIAQGDTLQKLTFDGHVNVLAWRETDHELRNPLLSIFGSSTLQTLEIRGPIASDFPMEILTIPPALKHLVFNPWYADGENIGVRDNVEPLQITHPPFVEHRPLLSLKFDNPITGERLVEHLTQPQCPIKLHSLRELQLGVISEKMERLAWEVMKIANKTLERFHYSSRSSFGGIPQPVFYDEIRMDNLDSLRFLEFSIYPCMDDIFWMTLLIKTWRIPEHVESIKLNFGCFFNMTSENCYNLRDIGEAMTHPDNRLDETLAALCGKKWLPSLHTIEILVFFTDSHFWKPNKDTGELLNEWFPLLGATGCFTGRILDADRWKGDNNLAWGYRGLGLDQ